MIPAQFDYVRPGSLDEALRILVDREGEAKLLSGGYSLIPLIKLRLAQPALLVDMRAIPGLDGIAETDDDLVIGARATHRQVAEAPVVVAKYPSFVELALGVGDPQVRNWGTIGGSVAHADPASDWPALLLAVNARLICRGPAGTREIAARDFFLDTFTTAIEPTEVLTEIRIGRRGAGTGGAYTKIERKAGDLSTVGVAAIVRIDAGGAIVGAGIGVTGVSPAAYASPARRGGPGRQAAVRRGVPRGGRRGRGAEPARLGRPRTRGLQAGDGRRAHPSIPPPRHRARPHVQRVGDDEHPAHLPHRER